MTTTEIADAVIAKYGIKPAMELIDLARTDKFLTKLGCKDIRDIFYVAQAINAKVGA